MRILLFTILFFPTLCFSRQLYFSNAGNDGNPGTFLSPFATITKANSYAVSGDTLYFNRGDIFTDTTILVKVSNVTYSAYGIGSNPVISGFVSLTIWTNVGANLWEATVPGGLTNLNMVVINGKLTPKGRLPNSGYYYRSAAVSNTGIVTALSGTPNYTGAELYIRRNNYASSVVKITSQSGGQLNFAPIAGGSGINSNYGYFIQNVISVLDVEGEWAYNAGTAKITMYSVGAPSNVKVAKRSNLVYSSNGNGTQKTNVKFTNLDFQGSNDNAVFTWWCNNFTFDSCNIQYAGESAINQKYTVGFTVSNCNISDANMMGVTAFNSIGSTKTVVNNKFKRIGVYPGMYLVDNSYTYYGDGDEGVGIKLVDSATLVKGNVFDSIGYCAIVIGSNENNQVIAENEISNYTLVKKDGGGIYVSGRRLDPAFTTGYILNNYIHDAGNASDGTGSTFPHTRGIYGDATTENMVIRGNTMSNTYEGIYLSAAVNNVVDSNLFYGGGNYLLWASGMMAWNNANAGYQLCRNNRVTNNVFYTTGADDVFQNLYDNFYGGGDSLAIIDSNKYINTTAINKFANVTGVVNVYHSTFAAYKAGTNYDASSVYSTSPSYNLYVNNTNAPYTLDFNGYSKKDAYERVFNNSVIIPAMRSFFYKDNGLSPTIYPSAKLKVFYRLKQ